MDCTLRSRACRVGEISVWHPEALNVGALLGSYGQRVGEGVLWLGHCVYVGLADDARCRDTGQVPLRTECLRTIVGRHHLDAVRQAATDIGYVERDPSYRTGLRSQTYSVSSPFDQARLLRREITHSGLRHNIRRWREDRRRQTWQRVRRHETPVREAVCAHLWRHLQRVRIDAQIDFGSAFHPAHQVAVEHVRAGELWFTPDDYGRIHTNVTNLPKTLRQYLSVDGRRLANVDIAESQPLFMGLALANNETTRQTHKATKGKPPRADTGRATHYHMLDNTMLDTHNYLEGGFDRNWLPEDHRRYLQLCEARGLYEAVADRLGKTRDEAKRAVMVAFFDKPWHRNAVCAVLEGLFPSVMRAMRDIKRPDYRRLAHLAQRIESRFMFGRVVPKVMELRPDLFIATIHDSILTPVGEAEFVRQVMRDEFARLGLSPQVKVEACSRTC